MASSEKGTDVSLTRLCRHGHALRVSETDPDRPYSGTSLRRTIERLLALQGMTLEEFVRVRRSYGQSWIRIAEALTALIHVEVSREALRRWFGGPLPEEAGAA